MTKLLALSPQMPYPPDNGGKEGIWGFCASLAQKGINVTLICASSRDHVSVINNIEIIEYKYSKIDSFLNIFVSLIKLRHYKFEKYQNRKVCKQINDQLKLDPKTKLISFHPHMAVNFKKLGLDGHFYLRSHNIESDLVFEYLYQKNLKLLNFIGKIAQRHELDLWSQSRKVFFLNDRDAERAGELGLDKSKIALAYEGVEPMQSIEDSVIFEKFKSKSIGYLYNSSAAQNIYNLKKFLQDIWVPSKLFDDGVKLIISGNSQELVTNAVGKEFQSYGIYSTGYLDDVSDFYRQITALVSPTFVGAGVRKKILESMNHSTPAIMTALDRVSLSYLNQDLMTTFTTVDDFRSKTSGLLCNFEVYREKCVSCNEAIASFASWDRCTSEVLRII